ncbi:MAG: hypothetical protein QOE35_297 [Actinomycetota bacterium]|jgi:archaellum component FlaC
MEPDPPAPRDQDGFRLAWPANETVEPFQPRDQPRDDQPEPDDAAQGAEPWVPPARDPAPAPAASLPLRDAAPSLDGGDTVAALAAVAARVDVLSSATVTFRNVVADKVSDYTERVSHAIAEHSSALEQAMKGRDRVIGEIGSDLHSLSTRLHQLEGSVEELTDLLGVFRSEVNGTLESIADQVQALRRRTAVRPASGRDELPEKRTRPAADNVSGKARSTSARRRPRQD